MVLPGAVSHQVGVVGWSRIGYSPTGWTIQNWSKTNGVKFKPGAAGVEVAKVVGENLQLISAEVAVIPQHVVVARS